jgi:hypothetical protein
VAEVAFICGSPLVLDRCFGATDSESKDDFSTVQCLVEYLLHKSKKRKILHLSINRLQHNQQGTGNVQKFPDWQSGARTANGTALCH